MDDRIKEQFPWMASIQGKFFETLLGDSEIGTLEQLQWNIAEEIEKLEHNWNFKTAKLLLKGVEFFYFKLCRICSFKNEDFSSFVTFSSEMKRTWSFVLSSFIKICLLLSRGKTESKWISHALKEISKFPGEQHLLFDALLLVQRLNNKFKDAYGAILKNLLADLTSFLPLIIDDPDEFLKAYLLVRRLRLRLKGAAEKVDLHCRVSRILAPPSLWDWLLDHGFNVPWTRKGFRKVNLGMDLCSKLGGRPKAQLKIAKALRKILLPGLSTKGEAEQLKPYTDYISATDTFDDDKLVSEKKSKKARKSVRLEENLQTIHAEHPVQEDDNENLRKSKIKFKSNMLNRWNNDSQEDGEEGTSVSRPDLQKPTRADSDENASCEINHTWALTTFDDDKLDLKKKSKKKCKSVQSEQRKQKLNKIARKVLTEDDQNINKDSSVVEDSMEDKEEIMDRRSWPDMDHEDNEDRMGHSGYEGESKSQKRRQKEKTVGEKNPDDMNVSSSDLEDISQNAKVSKSKGRRLKAKQLSISVRETEFITDKNESDADDSKVLNEDDQSINKDSCILKDNRECKEGIMGRRNWLDIDHEDNEDRTGHSGYEGESKSQKRRQKEKTVAEKNPDDVNVSSSDLEDISQIAEVSKSKRRRLRQKARKLDSSAKEIEFIADKNESDADNSKVLNEDDQSINKHSCVLKDNRECKEAIMGRRNWPDMDHEDKEYCKGNSGYESEPKSKKRKLKEKMTAEKNPDGANVTSSDPEDISQTAEISKSKRRLRRQRARKLDSSSKENELSADKNESDADDSPVIVKEIYVYEPVSKKRVAPNKEDSDSNSSDDDQPVILKEVQHSHDSDLDSSLKTEIKSNEIIAENIFIIDSKPSPCLSKSGANQIAYDTIYDAEQMDASSCIKPKNISNSGENLTTSVPFSKLSPNLYSLMMKEAVESDSRSRITDCSYTTKETQGVYTGSSSPFRSDQQKPISEKKIRTSLDNQTNLSMDYLDGKLKGVDNVIASTTVEHSAQTDEEPLRDTLVQIESLENCIKSDPISDKLVDRKEKTPIQTDFEMETIQETKISQAALPVLESHRSPVSSSLNSDNSAQEVEKQKNEHPSIEIDELITVRNEVNSETSHIDTETKENNTKVIADSELSYESSALCCNAKRKEPTQETNVSESPINSPLSNTSCLETGKISSQNMIATVSSESVDISSPEKMNNNCSINMKSESQPESLELHGPPVSGHSSLNDNNSAQKVEKQKDGHPSVKTVELISVENEVNSSETNHIDTETTENNAKVIAESELVNAKSQELTRENQVSESLIDSPLGNTSCLKTGDISPQNLIATVSSESVDLSSPERINVVIKNNNCSMKVKSELPLESFSSDSSLPDKTITQAVSDSGSESSSKTDNLEVKKESNDTSTDMHKPSPNNSTHDRPKYQVTGLFIDAKSPTSKCKESLHKNSEESPNHEMLNEIAVPNLDSKAKSTLVETPNTSAARKMMEKVLTLTEFAGCHKESIKQIFTKEDLISTLNSVSEKQLTFSTVNEKPVASISFLDISAESGGCLNESQSFSCRTSESSEFLQYRDLSSDEDNISEDISSERKSASDVSNDSEGESNSLKGSNSPISSCQEEDYEYDTSCSQSNEKDVSTETMPINVRNMNPVVNLGIRCDSKNFIDSISNVSADPISIPTSSSVVPDIKAENEEVNETRYSNPNEASLTVGQMLTPKNKRARKLDSIQQSISVARKDLPDSKTENEEVNGTKPFSPNEASSAVDQLLTPVNETARKLDNTQQTILVGMKHEEVSIVDIVKEEIQPQYEDVKPCLNAVHTENPMADDESTGGLDEGRILRSRHSSSPSSQENPASADEDSSVLNQDVSKTNCMTLRGQNPSPLNSREQMAYADGTSNVVNQGAPVIRRMNLRGRNSTMSSSQGMSAPANEGLSVVNQDTPATRRRNLGNKNPSTSPIPEVKKHKSQTITKRSSKRLKKEVNANLGSHFSELSLNSPRALRSKPNDSTSKTSSEVGKEPSTSDKGNPFRRTTRASVISSTEDSKLKEKDNDPEGYNLRSRKSVIMPGKLNL